MRIAVAASPAVAIPSIEAIASSKHDLVRIISQPDRPSGRGRTLAATPVTEWALSKEIEVVRPERASDLSTIVQDVDCVITIGYGLLIPKEILEIPKYGFLNVHFSLLPRWRGAAPVQRAIEAGDALSGITVFKLDEGMDTGPYYLMSRFALDSDITSDQLLNELGEIAPETLLATLELVESGSKPIAQNNGEATRAHKLTRDEAHVDLSKSAEEVSAKIRAFTSNPGAWVSFRGSSMKITIESISDVSAAPGELLKRDGKLLLGTGSKAIVLGYITPSGKSPQSASAWLNGARLAEGERCE